jgi:DNA-binding protein H-NS
MSKPHFSELTAQTLPEWRPEIDLEEMAKADRVWGKPKGIKKGGKLEPKYANPHDPNQTWSGRGNPPQWVLNLTGDRQLGENALLEAMKPFRI